MTFFYEKPLRNFEWYSDLDKNGKNFQNCFLKMVEITHWHFKDVCIGQTAMKIERIK